MISSQDTQRRAFWDSGWPENLASALAFLGLTISVFVGFNPYGRQNAGSDFKTLYASAWCYSHHLDAYQFPCLASVFQANGVVEPRSWYGHAPVYPPFTLALLAPITALRMVPATCLWIVGCGVLMAFATAALARSAGRVFGVPIALRLLIVGLVAASPLVSLGLELGNVSVAVTALCILALVGEANENQWLPAGGMAVALILKPHIAFWAVLSMVLSRASISRRLVASILFLTTGLLGLILVWMLADHNLVRQIAGYKAIVASELSNGSMAPGNRDLMEIVVQITSFSHLLGYLLKPGFLPQILNVVVLCGLAVALVWSALRFNQASVASQYAIAPAVFGFGLTATYHREADSMVLLFLLPFLLFRLYRNTKDLWAWGASGLLVAGSVGPSLAMLHWLAERDGVYTVLRFLALRQGAVVNLCLTVMLIAALAAGSRDQATVVPRSK